MAPGLKIEPTKPLELGWISYWNLAPLKVEIQRVLGDEVRFHNGTPAMVNKWLETGKVAIGPCSSVCLLQHDTHELAFPLGIASTGPVASVYIGLHREHAPIADYIRARQKQLREVGRRLFKSGQDARRAASVLWEAAHKDLKPLAPGKLPPIVMSQASASSVTLGRILHRLWFGVPPQEFKPSERGITGAVYEQPPELLIGDEALTRRPVFSQIIDLGEAWYELTGLPFVFSVWQRTRKTLSPYWSRKICAAAELAQVKMKVDPSTYLPDMPATDCLGHAIDLANYWKSITYQLGPAHMRGLFLFLCLARLLRPEATGDAAVARIMRWESQAATGSVLS